MATLRASQHPIPLTDIAWPDPDQLTRCAMSLVTDGLAVQDASGLILPD